MIENLCPLCAGEPVTLCRCPRRDCSCENGHHWAACLVHDFTISHNGRTNLHAMDTMACICHLDVKMTPGEAKAIMDKRNELPAIPWEPIG